MSQFAHVFDDLYEKYVKPLRSDVPTIIFPDIPNIRYSTPFKIFLLKMFRDNNLVKIITPDDIGVDVVKTLQDQIGFRKWTLSGFILNDKTVWFDYGDKSATRNSSFRKIFKRLRTDQVAGIVKFQYSAGEYERCPVPVFPFLYPGPNDFKRNVARWPYCDIQKYRDIYDECYRTNTFNSSVFARWAPFKTRKRVAMYAKEIPDSDIKSDIVQFNRYMANMASSMFGIMARGNGKHSHREMEACSIGVPLLYRNTGHRWLIPFKPYEHYIPYTARELPKIIEYYRHHYDEAHQIGMNAREYYDNYHTHTGIQRLLKELIDMILAGKRFEEYEV